MEANTLTKTMKVIWNKENLYLTREVFLEGDLNIAKLDLTIEEFVPGSSLKVTYYNDTEKKLYTVIEQNLSRNTILTIPNEVLQHPGTVFIRLTQQIGDQILQATEEIYFYVVKKKITNS